MTAIGTAVSTSHLAMARVLLASVARHHPEVTRYLAVLDAPGSVVSDAGAHVVLGRADVEPVPDDPHRFGYSVPDVVVAAKGRLLRRMLADGHPRAAYLDADMLVTGDLAPLLRPADPGAVVLVPHLLEPGDGSEAAFERERNLLLVGTYNAGCLSVADSPASLGLVDWLCDRLATWCRRDLAHGLFYDQRWLDLAPAYGPVEVARDPGLDVAYWNLHERPVTVDGDDVRAGDGPCRCFHFSGFDPDGDRPSRHSTMDWAQAGGARALYERYRALLVAAGWSAASWRADAGIRDTFADGLVVPEAARLAWRLEHPSARRAHGDPRAVGPGSFRATTARVIDDGPAPLWLAVHALRADVRRAYPDPTGADRGGFRTWVANSGPAEHPDVAAVVEAERRA